MIINPSKGFRSHFKEASYINRRRKEMYLSLTAGQSCNVSNILIFYEKLLYPVAWYFDRRAIPFNRKGVGIIADDFVSLGSLPPVNRKPLYNNKLSFKLIGYLAKEMFRLRCSVRKSLKNYNFHLAHTLLCESIAQISQLEESNKVHITMLRHIIESAAFAAKNAVHYSKDDDIKLKKLVSLFIRTQLLGTILSPMLDRSASKIHKLGVGIVYNDLPQIPYK
jgi:hypothetical protein